MNLHGNKLEKDIFELSKLHIGAINYFYYKNCKYYDSIGQDKDNYIRVNDLVKMDPHLCNKCIILYINHLLYEELIYILIKRNSCTKNIISLKNCSQIHIKSTYFLENFFHPKTFDSFFNYLIILEPGKLDMLLNLRFYQKTRNDCHKNKINYASIIKNDVIPSHEIAAYSDIIVRTPDQYLFDVNPILNLKSVSYEIFNRVDIDTKINLIKTNVNADIEHRNFNNNNNIKRIHKKSKLLDNIHTINRDEVNRFYDKKISVNRSYKHIMGSFNIAKFKSMMKGIEKNALESKLNDFSTPGLLRYDNKINNVILCASENDINRLILRGNVPKASLIITGNKFARSGFLNLMRKKVSIHKALQNGKKYESIEFSPQNNSTKNFKTSKMTFTRQEPNKDENVPSKTILIGSNTNQLRSRKFSKILNSNFFNPFYRVNKVDVISKSTAKICQRKKKFTQNMVGHRSDKNSKMIGKIPINSKISFSRVSKNCLTSYNNHEWAKLPNSKSLFYSTRLKSSDPQINLSWMVADYNKNKNSNCPNNDAKYVSAIMALKNIGSEDLLVSLAKWVLRKLHIVLLIIDLAVCGYEFGQEQNNDNKSIDSFVLSTSKKKLDLIGSDFEYDSLLNNDGTNIQNNYEYERNYPISPYHTPMYDSEVYLNSDALLPIKSLGSSFLKKGVEAPIDHDNIEYVNDFEMNNQRKSLINHKFKASFKNLMRKFTRLQISNPSPDQLSKKINPSINKLWNKKLKDIDTNYSVPGNLKGHTYRFSYSPYSKKNYPIPITNNVNKDMYDGNKESQNIVKSKFSQTFLIWKMINASLSQDTNKDTRLKKFVPQNVKSLRSIIDINIEDIINWIKRIDRKLCAQGWQDLNFSDEPANIIFLFGILKNQFSVQTILNHCLTAVKKYVKLYSHRTKESLLNKSFRTATDSGYGDNSPYQVNEVHKNILNALTLILSLGEYNESHQNRAKVRRYFKFNDLESLTADPTMQNNDGQIGTLENIEINLNILLKSDKLDDNGIQNFESAFQSINNGKYMEITETILKALSQMSDFKAMVKRSIMSTLYISFCYMGNEISYPVKPFFSFDYTSDESFYDDSYDSLDEGCNDYDYNVPHKKDINNSMREINVGKSFCELNNSNKSARTHSLSRFSMDDKEIEQLPLNDGNYPFNNDNNMVGRRLVRKKKRSKKEEFWMECLNIIDNCSHAMLMTNSEPNYLLDLYQELVTL
ncbi:unnamed protein product [Gordionus sp. m RMFG-2023]|uniref:uncharacterized protein LOC135931268 n=1 Tax=Gordionus sp. m RMFG-2023 TaxID=3053472 RepID=UPI0030DF5496